jgi:hypothetical protein
MDRAPQRPGRALDSAVRTGRVMTRDEARQLERQIEQRYPQCRAEVTRVFGGAQVEASDGQGWVFIRADNDSPLLHCSGRITAIIGAIEETLTPAVTLEGIM